jgi:hypothetical protein
MFFGGKNQYLDFHFQAISESQGRARVALFLILFASSTILVTEWNSYLSWDQKWAAETSELPSHWGQEQLLTEQIRSWVETNTVNVALLGIRVSVSDAAVLGSIILFILSVYLCIALRRENHDVASLFRVVSSKGTALRHTVLLRAQSSTLLGPRNNNDAPFTALSGVPPKRQSLPLMPSVRWLLTFLPVLTIVAVIASDLWYASGYFSPWLRNRRAVWYALSPRWSVQLIAMDIVAGICGVLTCIYSLYSWRYQQGTLSLIEDFRRRLLRPRRLARLLKLLESRRTTAAAT